MPPTVAPSDFEKCLQTALKHYADVEWLGNNSPLAQPYFLGASTQLLLSPAQRGQALREAIDAAWKVLWDGIWPLDEATFLKKAKEEIFARNKGHQYAALVLELSYLRRVIHPKKRSIIWEDHLAVSKAQYHRDLSDAVQLLGTSLLRIVHPHLYLEHPIPPPALYGRQKIANELFEILQTRQGVALSGPSGIGKSSLAAALCQRWPNGYFFWYTIRPHLSDRLEHLLFALAFFLHQHHRSDLWQQILADNGQVKNIEIAESLARHALKQLNPVPLLVIDDADLLRPATFEMENREYVRMVGFLESLGDDVTLLCVGQRAILPAFRHVELEGLTFSALNEWLQTLGYHSQPEDVQALLNYTSGTPRLLVLCLALIQNGSAAKEITSQLKSSPGAKPLVDRILRQMSDTERQLLMELAIFRRAAPIDLWKAQQPILDTLCDRGLAQRDLTGGISLLSVWADLILNDFPPEIKANLHLWAAQARAERGEYTESAYHYWQGGYPEMSIQIWYANRAYAISVGQAANALTIFNAISAHRLPRAEQQALALIRAELAQMSGDFEQGLRHLSDLSGYTSRAAVDAHKLRGRLLFALGYNEGALQEYQAGLDILAAMTREKTTLLTHRSARFKDEGEFSRAWHEIKHAQYLIEAFQGNLLDRQGQYIQAKQSYLRALDLAKEIGDNTYLARTYNNIGILAAFREPQEAFPYFQAARDAFQKIGDRVEVQLVQNNLVIALMQLGRYAEALPLAQDVTRFFIDIQNRPNSADAAVNLSEILFNLGRLEDATRWAEVAMAQEQTAVIPYALYIIGLIDNAQRNYVHAETCFHEIIHAETSEPYIIACAWRGLGQTYQYQHQKDKAQQAFCQAIQMFEQQGMHNQANQIRAESS